MNPPTYPLNYLLNTFHKSVIFFVLSHSPFWRQNTAGISHLPLASGGTRPHYIYGLRPYRQSDGLASSQTLGGRRAFPRTIVLVLAVRLEESAVVLERFGPHQGAAKRASDLRPCFVMRLKRAE